MNNLIVVQLTVDDIMLLTQVDDREKWCLRGLYSFEEKEKERTTETTEARSNQYDNINNERRWALKQRLF